MNAVEFLKTLYGEIEQGYLECTLIAPPELKLYPRTKVLWKRFPLSEIDPRLPTLHAFNQSGYGIYFGLAVRKDRKQAEWRVNRKTGEKYRVEFPRGWQKDSLYLTAFFADIDAKDCEGNLHEARRRAESIHPSLLVASGGGYHAYCLLDTPLLITDENRGAIKRTLKGIAHFVGGDTHVAELARVFRLPDTINTKPERAAALCSVVGASPERYTYSDLFNRYAPLIPVKTRPERDSSALDPTSEDEIVRALNCIPAGQIDYHEWLKVLAGLTHSLGADKAARIGEDWSGYCSQSGEIESKVASFDGDTGSQTASIGSVFWIAERFGYQRRSKRLTTENKLAVRDHLQQLKGTQIEF